MDKCLNQNYKLCPKLEKIAEKRYEKEIYEGMYEKSPFRRCVDGLSQKKFDDREYCEISEALTAK